MCLCGVSAHGHTLEEAQRGLIPQEPPTFFEAGFLSKQARLTSRGVLETRSPPQCWEVSRGQHSWESDSLSCQSNLISPASPSRFIHCNGCSRGPSLVWGLSVSICLLWVVKIFQIFHMTSSFAGKTSANICSPDKSTSSAKETITPESSFWTNRFNWGSG